MGDEIHAALSPFSRMRDLRRAVSWFYGELVARWLGARGAYLDVMFFQDEPHLKRVRCMHLSARGLAWAATRTIESTGPLWATLWGAPMPAPPERLPQPV